MDCATNGIKDITLQDTIRELTATELDQVAGGRRPGGGTGGNSGYNTWGDTGHKSGGDTGLPSNSHGARLSSNESNNSGIISTIYIINSTIIDSVII
jgi:hypothetical protein